MIPVEISPVSTGDGSFSPGFKVKTARRSGVKPEVSLQLQPLSLQRKVVNSRVTVDVSNKDMVSRYKQGHGQSLLSVDVTNKDLGNLRVCHHVLHHMTLRYMSSRHLNV